MLELAFHASTYMLHRCIQVTCAISLAASGQWPMKTSLDVFEIVSADPHSPCNVWSLLISGLTLASIFFFLDFHAWTSKLSKQSFHSFFLQIWSMFFWLLFVLFKTIYKITIFFTFLSSFNFFLFSFHPS